MLNLLKEIDVTGNLFPTHGRISLKFTFHNPTNHPLSPTYFFPLPKDASITGMQILTCDKILLRADIVPADHLNIQQDGFRLVQMEPQLYSLTWECLPAGDTCTIMIECLLHLLPHGNRCRLVLPFGLPSGPFGATSPCPVNLDFTLNGLAPSVLSSQDFFDSNTGIFSSTAQTNEDFVLDLAVQSSEPWGYLQEEFGKGHGFARLFFPTERLEHQPDKLSFLFLLDISHTSTLRDGNTLKELFFHATSAVPDDASARYITEGGLLPPSYTKDELYQHLQSIPVGVGDTENLFRLATEHQTPNTLTILISDGSYLPDLLPEFPVMLLTSGVLCPTTLGCHLSGNHLHFYPKDNPEEILSDLFRKFLSPLAPIEVVPEGGNIHDCLTLSLDTTLAQGYLDVAFSYSGRPPQGFALWQNGQKKLACPLTNTNKMPRFPDAEQMYAITKLQNLTNLLEKASPVSGRSIKSELAKLQTEFRILGTETALSIPGKGESPSGIPAGFYLASDGISSHSDRPTIFGEGVRGLPQSQRDQLANQCRKVIYNSIRSNGSIHSPLGITPRMSAEETALSYLALLADGKTDKSILNDALSYLKTAPETPWDSLIHSGKVKESVQKILPSLPDFETLLDSLGDSIPLMTADYLLLWLSLL